MRIRLLAAIVILALASGPLVSQQPAPQQPARQQDDEWASYGHDPGGQRFSPLTDINVRNVASLKVAWTFRTGDAYQPEESRPTAFEATPLYVDGIIYLGTPLGHVIALDPVTGKQRWSYDSAVPKDKGYGDFANRGVSTWKS